MGCSSSTSQGPETVHGGPMDAYGLTAKDKQYESMVLAKAEKSRQAGKHQEVVLHYRSAILLSPRNMRHRKNLIIAMQAQLDNDTWRSFSQKEEVYREMVIAYEQAFKAGYPDKTGQLHLKCAEYLEYRDRSGYSYNYNTHDREKAAAAKPFYLQAKKISPACVLPRVKVALEDVKKEHHHYPESKAFWYQFALDLDSHCLDDHPDDRVALAQYMLQTSDAMNDKTLKTFRDARALLHREALGEESFGALVANFFKAEEHITQAGSHFSQDDHAAADAAARRALEILPSSPRPYGVLFWLVDAGGSRKKYASDVAAAISLNKFIADFHGRHSKLHIEAGDLEEALHSAKTAAKLEPQGQNWQLEIQDVNCRIEKRKSDFDETIRQNKDPEKLHQMALDFWDKKDDYHGALALRTAITLRPSAGIYHGDLGDVVGRIPAVDEDNFYTPYRTAAQHYRAALRLDPGNAQAMLWRMHLASCHYFGTVVEKRKYLQRPNWAESRKCHSTIKREPTAENFADMAREYRADVYNWNGHRGSMAQLAAVAAEAWQVASSLDPKNPQAGKWKGDAVGIINWKPTPIATQKVKMSALDKRLAANNFNRNYAPGVVGSVNQYAYS